MKQAIQDLFRSKKFLAGLAAMICWAAAHWGFNVSATEATEFVSGLGLFIVGQGVADHGKPAAEAMAKAVAAQAAAQQTAGAGDAGAPQ